MSQLNTVSYSPVVGISNQIVKHHRVILHLLFVNIYDGAHFGKSLVHIHHHSPNSLPSIKHHDYYGHQLTALLAFCSYQLVEIQVPRAIRSNYYYIPHALVKLS